MEGTNEFSKSSKSKFSPSSCSNLLPVEGGNPIPPIKFLEAHSNSA